MLKGAFIFWQKAVAERLNTNLSKSWEMCTNYHTNCAQHRTLAACKTSAGLGANGRSAASSWWTFPQPIPRGAGDTGHKGPRSRPPRARFVLRNLTQRSQIKGAREQNLPGVLPQMHLPRTRVQTHSVFTGESLQR